MSANELPAVHKMMRLTCKKKSPHTVVDTFSKIIHPDERWGGSVEAPLLAEG